MLLPNWFIQQSHSCIFLIRLCSDFDHVLHMTQLGGRICFVVYISWKKRAFDICQHIWSVFSFLTYPIVNMSCFSYAWQAACVSIISRFSEITEHFDLTQKSFRVWDHLQRNIPAYNLF